MDNDLMFSRNRNDWETPPEVFNPLNEIFHFTVDCAASAENTKCPRFFGEGDNIILNDTDSAFQNPPYTTTPRNLVFKIVNGVYEQARIHRVPVVILLPARTETKIWQKIIFKMDYQFFFEGRLKFINPHLPSYRADGNFKISPAPFPSALGIMNASHEQLADLQKAFKGILR